MTEHIRADADAPAIRADGAAGVSGVVVGAATDVGRLRTVNEDGYLAIAPAFVVVDGMGGHAAGRMATQVALDSLYSLAGATISGDQLAELAPLLATHLGLRVEDQDDGQNPITGSRRA